MTATIAGALVTSLPVFSPPGVYHIGTLDPVHVGVNSGKSSREGHHLSVSLCPAAWRRVAKLGDYPWHALERQDSLFLDASIALEDSGLRDVIQEWAIGESLLEPMAGWWAWTFNDELDDWTGSWHATQEEAMVEVDPDDEYRSAEQVPGPDGEPGVHAATIMVMTEKLAKAVGAVSGTEGEAALDYALLLWAETQAPKLLGKPLDGVWWHERYDPGAHSAPRGCIFRDRVSAWSAQTIPEDSVEDETELHEQPNPELIDVATGVRRPYEPDMDEDDDLEP